MSPRTRNQQRFRDEFREESGGYEWHPWRWFFGSVGILLVLFFVAVACTAVTMPFKSALGIGERVTNPDNVIFQYEKFHDLCAGIAAKHQQQSAAAKAAAAHDRRTEGKPDPLGRNAEESARLHQDAEGIRQALMADTEKYNADSRKWTQKHFKAKGLPYRIEPGVAPQCDAQPVTTP